VVTRIRGCISAMPDWSEQGLGPATCCKANGRHSSILS
jgi:hypothetical protein